MRAAVLFEQGKPQRVEELDLESPRRGEVLVRMAASGVCHSCLHAALAHDHELVVSRDHVGVVDRVVGGDDEAVGVLADRFVLLGAQPQRPRAQRALAFAEKR